MIFTLTAFLWLVLVAGPLGWKIGGRGRAVWIPVAVLALAGLVAYPLLGWRPDMALRVLPWRVIAAVDDSWFVPFAALFFGIAARQAPRRGTQVGAIALAVLLIGLGGASAGWLVSGADVPVGERVDANGVVRQTTGYTCGAAASATFLRLHGLSATEREMARATMVVPMRGTTMLKLYWAMDDVFRPRGRTVELRHCPVLEPGLVPTPCLADVRLGPLVDHVVVVREVGPSGITLDDPMHGVSFVGIEAARAMWRGSILSLAPTPPSVPVTPSPLMLPPLAPAPR